MKETNSDFHSRHVRNYENAARLVSQNRSIRETEHDPFQRRGAVATLDHEGSGEHGLLNFITTTRESDMAAYGGEVEFIDADGESHFRYTKLFWNQEQAENAVMVIVNSEQVGEPIGAYVCEFFVYEPEMVDDGTTTQELQKDRIDMGVSSCDRMIPLI